MEKWSEFNCVFSLYLKNIFVHILRIVEQSNIAVSVDEHFLFCENKSA